MRHYFFLLLAFVLISNGVLAQPSNNDPCNAKVIMPTQQSCNAFEDNTLNSVTSLINATMTIGSGASDYNCDYSTMPNLYDVWFKIPLDSANLVVRMSPIPGFDVSFQIYYWQSGSCLTNDFMLSELSCVNTSGAGLADSIIIPTYFVNYFDTLFVRVFHHPNGNGTATVNNSQFNICAYHPELSCVDNTSPTNGEQRMMLSYLNWSSNANAALYNVFLGSSVATAVLVGQSTSTSFNVTSLNLSAGTYYWYVVPMNGASSATGCASTASSFTILETAANNLICNASELVATPNSCVPFIDSSAVSTTSYYNSTKEGGIFGGGINCNYASLNADVWFKFTSPDSAYYIFKVDPVAGINTSFRIYESSADCAGSLNNLGCFNTGATAAADSASLLLKSGKQYFVQVFSENGSRDFIPPGNSQFGICIYKPAPACLNPLLVAPANASITVDHINGSLSWKAVNGATRYDLYIGTSAANMQLVNYQSLQNVGVNKLLNFQTNFSVSSPFFPGQQYFWKIVPLNNNFANTNCIEEIRSFTTYECPPSLAFFEAIISVNQVGELDYRMPCLNCPALWMVFEYGPNPNHGTDTSAAVGNTVVYPVEQTTPWGYKGREAIDMDSLGQIPSYKYYVRFLGCPSINKNYLSTDPGPIESFTVCTIKPIPIGNGKGRWEFNGQYPINSVGRNTPGKMTWFNFAPTESAVYYLQVDSLEMTDKIDYLYKVDSMNRYSPNDWIGIASINEKGKYPIGYLTAGQTYHFVADSENDSLLNRTTFHPSPLRHFIKICKADVTAPVVTNTCIEANIYNAIPAFSPKEEFAIDTSGRLIASIKPGNDSLGFISVSYYVNGNGLRHDANGVEYLDRNFTITPSNNPASAQHVKLFFPNTELATLINAPNDGNADVNSINDLVVTKTNQTCSTSSNAGTFNNLFITPIESDVYSTNSGYVSVPVSSFSTFYLHSGNFTALSLRILSFTAETQKEKVKLKWKTDNEKSTSHFLIERSFDGVSFHSLGSLKSANADGEQEYQYFDDSPKNGINLYRLKQVDLDMNYTYSKIRSVFFTNDSELKVYPTVTSSSFTVYGLTMDMSFNLTDMNGKSLIKGKATKSKMEIDLKDYSEGMYLLSISDFAGIKRVFKILKE